MTTLEAPPAARTVQGEFLDLCRRLGMTTFFGNPGSTELRMFRDWPADFRYVLGLQESTVLGVAAGYAATTGNAAPVSLHSAAGVGHALGSVYNAYLDRVPLVLIAGQQTRALCATRPLLFSQDPTTLAKPYVKWSHQPLRGQDVPAAVAEAYHVAMTPPRGPVFLSVPEDDWELPAEPVAAREIHHDFVGSPAGLAAVAAALDGAERPALVVGPGVDEDGAGEQARLLAERLNAAVWVSPLSSRCSFPEGHPLFAGFLQPTRRLVHDHLAPYDVVAVIGAPVFTYHVASEGPYLPPGTRLFHLDCDPATIAWAPVGTSVLTTVRAGLAALLDRVGDAGRPAPAPVERPAPPPVADPMGPKLLMHTLSRVLPADAVVVEEALTHRDEIHDLLPIRRPGGYLTAGGAALGWGLPASVGAALGSGASRVVCVIGDGATMYSIQAIWTAVQHRLPLTVVVSNNARYAAMKVLGEHFGIPDPPGSDLPGLDFTRLAAGMGCPAGRVTEAAGLEAALARALNHPGPYLLDVAVAMDYEPLYR